MSQQMVYSFPLFTVSWYITVLYYTISFVVLRYTSRKWRPFWRGIWFVNTVWLVLEQLRTAFTCLQVMQGILKLSDIQKYRKHNMSTLLYNVTHLKYLRFINVIMTIIKQTKQNRTPPVAVSFLNN